MQIIFCIAIGYLVLEKATRELAPEYKVVKFSRHVFRKGFKELIKYKETIADVTMISG